MKPAFSSSKIKFATCFHCGDSCVENKIVFDQHPFCCDGCKLVYTLLKENDLCNYYDITKFPGQAAQNEQQRAAYSSLDDTGVREKLIRFEDENISRVIFH